MDMSHIIKEHKGEWVALDEHKSVISHSKKGIDAYNEAQAKGYEKPLMVKVPQKTRKFAGHSSKLH